MRLSFLCLCLFATPALAETDVRAMLIEMARTTDCVLTEDQAEKTFVAMGLTKDDVRPVAQAMFDAGEAALVDGKFQLSAELCSSGTAATPTPAPAVPAVSPLMAQVIGVFAEAGCSLNEEQGMPRLAAVGITEDMLGTIRDETERLIAAGLIDRNETTNTITIAEPLCHSATVLSDPDEPLIRMLRENGCSLTQEAAGPLVARYGLTMETADEMADRLMDRGMAQAIGGALVLTDCGG